MLEEWCKIHDKPCDSSATRQLRKTDYTTNHATCFLVDANHDSTTNHATHVHPPANRAGPHFAFIFRFLSIM